MQPSRLNGRIREAALELGFDACRFASAKIDPIHGSNLEKFVGRKLHGKMSWMEETLERRVNARAMWAEARSAVVVAMNYGQRDGINGDYEAAHERAEISVYARNRDYHDVMKGRLKTLAGKMASLTGSDVKVFVDTAPLMEKPLAAQAGMGWQGKHTNLVSRDLGSWFFIGTVLTSADLQADEAEIDHCGSCTACLESCPTDAFIDAYKIDARRCISYLTIEHKGFFSPELRAKMGNRIYGCDDCLAACPWNKFASVASEAKLQAREDLNAPKLRELAKLDDAAFRKLFSGSPIKRIGRNRFIRNVLIAMGNSGATKFITDIKRHISDQDAIVRGHAVWALSRLCDEKEFKQLADQHSPQENDAQVLNEWQYGLNNGE